MAEPITNLPSPADIAAVITAPPATVAIVGCGWLGLPLARHLLAQGHRVLGTTTTPEQLPALTEAGIEARLLRLGAADAPVADDELTAWLTEAQVQVLVVNVPPRTAVAGGYPHLLRPLHRAVGAARLGGVVFVSSTGVYPDEPRLMREADALSTRDAASDVLRAEGHFVPRHGQWQSTVLRLGGLFGPGRAPGRFLAGRRELPLGDAPVNLLHLTDAVGVLGTVIGRGIWGHTLNVCALGHPPRREFYPVAAALLGLEPPTFLADGAGGKLIDSSRLRAVVPYAFRHDDVLAALADC